MVDKPSPSPSYMETAPWRHFRHGDREIIIDVNGGISINGTTTSPFPCEITFASMCDKGLVATWVDHELQLARMALLNLDEPVKKGISRAQLRLKRNSSMVEGSQWCHIIDAEPVALDAKEDMIVFALWSRGLYCIDSSSNEIWRLPLIELKGKSPPRSNEITSVSIIKDEVIAWTKGGTYQRISLTSGEVLQTEELGVECDIENVFSHDDSFLITSTDGWAWELLNDEITVARKLRGTIQHAVFDEDDWRIISWRDDLMLRGEMKARTELGVQIIKESENWMVLDNQGNRSPHMG